jgi:tRNA G18 (ribose-2'-O)-methylase SpoU
LVIGSEELGISQDLRSEGAKISLPQKNSDISFNASVAAGILMFIIKQKI